MAGQGVVMQPPVDVENATLVSSSLETTPLRNMLSWINLRIQEQQHLLLNHSARLRLLDAGGHEGAGAADALADAGADGPTPVTKHLQSSIKEELFAMQISGLRAELEARPKAQDVREQQRLAADETLQQLKGEIVNATEALHASLLKISSELTVRLEELEGRVQGTEAAAIDAAAKIASAEAAAAAAENPMRAQGALPRGSSQPVPGPVSATSDAAAKIASAEAAAAAAENPMRAQGALPPGSSQPVPGPVSATSDAAAKIVSVEAAAAAAENPMRAQEALPPVSSQPVPGPVSAASDAAAEIASADAAAAAAETPMRAQGTVPPGSSQPVPGPVSAASDTAAGIASADAAAAAAETPMRAQGTVPPGSSQLVPGPVTKEEELAPSQSLLVGPAAPQAMQESPALAPTLPRQEAPSPQQEAPAPQVIQALAQGATELSPEQAVALRNITDDLRKANHDMDDMAAEIERMRKELVIQINSLRDRFSAFSQNRQPTPKEVEPWKDEKQSLMSSLPSPSIPAEPIMEEDEEGNDEAKNRALVLPAPLPPVDQAAPATSAAEASELHAAGVPAVDVAAVTEGGTGCTGSVDGLTALRVLLHRVRVLEDAMRALPVHSNGGKLIGAMTRDVGGIVGDTGGQDDQAATAAAAAQLQQWASEANVQPQVLNARFDEEERQEPSAAADASAARPGSELGAQAAAGGPRRPSVGAASVSAASVDSPALDTHVGDVLAADEATEETAMEPDNDYAAAEAKPAEASEADFASDDFANVAAVDAPEAARGSGGSGGRPPSKGESKAMLQLTQRVDDVANVAAVDAPEAARGSGGSGGRPPSKGESKAMLRLTQRVDALEAIERKARVRTPSQSATLDVQMELERLRKLFEFVEGVMPKDKAEAMRFFQKGVNERAQGSEGAAKVLGQGVESELHRTKLEEEVRGRCDEMRHEFDNLTHIVKGVQRDMEHHTGKNKDLSGLVARVEQALQAMDGMRPSFAPSAGVVTAPPAGDLSHLLDSEGGVMAEDALPFATKRALQSALEGLKDDIQNWLGMLHASMLSALQQKADNDQLEKISRQLSQAAGVAGESIAAFAKRALLGRCASCDAVIKADPNKIARPVPVGGLQGQWPQRLSGAKDSIRPPEGKALLLLPPPSGDPLGANRLPRIQSGSDQSRQFPLRKVKKSSGSGSTPELRTIMKQVDPMSTSY